MNKLITPEEMEHFKEFFPNHNFANMLRRIPWLKRSFVVDFPAFVIDYVEIIRNTARCDTIPMLTLSEKTYMKNIIPRMYELDKEAIEQNEGFVVYLEKNFFANILPYHNHDFETKHCVLLRYGKKQLNV